MIELNPHESKILSQLIESGLDSVLLTIKQDIALDIIGTSPEEADIREDLYNLSRAIDAIKGKLQGCVNDTYNQE